jgi:hypothetical protein
MRKYCVIQIYFIKNCVQIFSVSLKELAFEASFQGKLYRKKNITEYKIVKLTMCKMKSESEWQLQIESRAAQIPDKSKVGSGAAE